MLVAPNIKTTAVFYNNNKITRFEVLFFSDTTKEAIRWDPEHKMLSGISRFDENFVGLLFGDKPNNLQVEQWIKQKQPMEVTI